jgi:hypothetical protein
MKEILSKVLHQVWVIAWVEISQGYVDVRLECALTLND